MIYQVSVKFHLTEPLVFNRKEDSLQIQPHQQQKLTMTIDRSKLTFMTEENQTYCKIYTTPYSAEEVDGKIVIVQSEKNKTEKTSILTISGSKNCCQQLQYTLGTHKKYKSCLSFVPSRVKHVSILSGESSTQRFRGFLNLIGIMFVILNLRNIIDNFVKYGVQFQRAPSDFIAMDTIVAGFTVLLFPMMVYIVEKVRFKRYIKPKSATFVEIIIICGIFAFNIHYCQRYNPIPLNGVFFTCFCIIIFLKMVSFIQVNIQLFDIIQKLKQNKKTHSKKITQHIFSQYEINEHNLQLIRNYQANWEKIVSFQKLIYFIAAPTLCYQLQYPRTSSIRYGWLCKRFIQFFLVTSLQIILWFQYIEPELKLWMQVMDRNQYTWVELISRLMRLSIPNTIMWITGFYNFFHLFLNISSEILKFADRMFYLDWWNCRSLEEYWKTWNLPVHFWFIRHLYNPLLRSGFSKVSSNLIVFLISAIAHEYAVAVPLRLVSYWAFLAMLSQAPAIFIQRKLEKELNLGNSELGNVMFWLFFCILGQPVIVFIYYSLYMKQQLIQAHAL